MPDDVERNEQVVRRFFDAVVRRGDAQGEGRRYVAPGAKHHNPHFAAGMDSLLKAMDDDKREHPTTLELLHVVAQGSFVVTHSRVHRADQDIAACHLFRLRDGKITEMWDVAQPAPEKTPNADGMF
jgi:predicted SnoaL-like aldol condensation-catalyzing enzyme